jgi:exoribonuclease-2
LVAPFKPRDANLFAIVSAFDAAYAAYGDFQSNMERYWCLRWLGQEKARQVEAVVLKDELLRLVEIPLVIKLAGMPQVARGTQVTLDILRWDEIDLSIEARLLEIEAAPDTAPDTAPGAVLAESEADADEAAEEGASVNLPEDAEEELAELASPTVISEPAVE